MLQINQRWTRRSSLQSRLLTAPHTREKLVCWQNVTITCMMVLECQKQEREVCPSEIIIRDNDARNEKRRKSDKNGGCLENADLENADLEKKKKRRTKGLKFITLASKGCFCVCDTSVFSRSAFSSSRKRRPRKRRPCKQRPRKHRRITSTLKNNSLCSRAYYGRIEFKSLSSSFLFLLLFAVLFPIFSNLFPISKSR